MSFDDGIGLPGDATLLLRIYAEHRWLAEELMALLEQVESQAWLLTGGPHDEVVAQLQSMWGDGQRRAAHTDRAFESVAAVTEDGGSWLERQTCSYYGWLRNLRATLAARIEPFLGDTPAAGHAVPV